MCLGYRQTIVLEVAVLDTIPEKSNKFVQVFTEAAPLLTSIEGYINHNLKNCIGTPSQFLLLVSWRTLKDHTSDCRKSPEYEQRQALLHHFYEPFPTIEHYE